MTFPKQIVPAIRSRSDGDTRSRLAFEALEKENAGLKELVVRLSETVLRHVVERK